MPADTRLIMKDITHVVMLIVLVFVLLFVVVKIGLIGCKAIPGYCDVYYSIDEAIFGMKGVLIVYGNDGLGDPELLKKVMADPNLLSVRAQTAHMSQVSIGNLKRYNLVIVEKSREVSTEQMLMFMDYVNQGGRLVWTGDAGVELAKGDTPLYEDERESGKEHKIIGPWARRKGDNMVSFDEFLALSYVGNYCDYKPCSQQLIKTAILVPEPTREHPLIYGLRQNIPLYVSSTQQFSIVKKISGMLSTDVLSADYGGNLIVKKPDSEEEDNLGSSTPIIVTSGFGERVAYYAMPPEYFVSEDNPDKYYTLVENMYIGMLKGR